MDVARWVREHRVRSELRPRYERRRGAVVPAGFELALLVGGPTLGDDPGAAECRGLHAALVEVARAAIPAELSPADYAPFDRAFHIAAGQHSLPEVELLVGLRSATSPALKRLEARLHELGVRTGGEPPVAPRTPQAPASEAAPATPPLRAAA